MFLKQNLFWPSDIFFVNFTMWFTQYIRFFTVLDMTIAVLRTRHWNQCLFMKLGLCARYIGGSPTKVYYVTLSTAAMNGVRGKDRSCHVRCVSARVRVRGQCARGTNVARYCSYCWGVPRPAPRSRGLCNLGEASKPARIERWKLEVSPGKVVIRRLLVPLKRGGQHTLQIRLVWTITQ